MKRIDEIDRHVPSEEAGWMKKRRDMIAEAPEGIKAYRKAEHFGSLEDRKRYVQQDRRRFLDLIGKAGISSGLIKASGLLAGVLANRHALAQDLTNKRVVFCYLNSGAQNTTWMPTSATSMNIVTQPYGPQGYNVASICHFREVDVMVEGHSNARQALGVPNYSEPTMDQRIAGVLGATSPHSSIYLGSQATTQGALCSTIGPCTDDPAKAFKDLFQSPLPTGTVDNTYELAYDAQLRAIQSIKSKLSQEEIQRLDMHGDAIAKIKQNLEDSLSGQGPDPSACGSSVGTLKNGNIQERGKTQADIIVAALACGLTKVATLQLGNHQGDWYGHNTVFKQDAHNSCHSAGGETNDEMVRYLSDVPAYFIDKLRKTMGPDNQPLINSTVFVQVTCMGNGRDHSSANGPFIVATQMPGFKSGFSTMRAGNIRDLNGAIPKGLGINGMLQGMGTSTLGLV